MPVELRLAVERAVALRRVPERLDAFVREREALLQPLDVALEGLAQPAGVAPGFLDELLKVLVEASAAGADLSADVLAQCRQRILRGIQRLVETLDRCGLVGGRALSRGLLRGLARRRDAGFFAGGI